MKTATDWQKYTDYKGKLSESERLWLEQWEREEYGCTYERLILSATQATQARANKARQSRDVLNLAIFDLNLIDRGIAVAKAKTEKAVKEKVKRAVKKAKAEVEEKLAPMKPNKAQLELTFVAYSTAVTCMEAAKALDKNTENNIAMAMDIFRKMVFAIIDEYAAEYGINAAQELMGVGHEPFRLPDDAGNGFDVPLRAVEGEA